MKLQTKIQIITLFVIIATCSTIVIATCSIIIVCASNEKGGGRCGMHGPPQKVIEACSGKSEGDGVTFTGGRGNM